MSMLSYIQASSSQNAPSSDGNADEASKVFGSLRGHESHDPAAATLSRHKSGGFLGAPFSSSGRHLVTDTSPRGGGSLNNQGYSSRSGGLLGRQRSHTKLLQPGEVETITFTCPSPGEYPYMCMFPGHTFMMNGVIKAE